MEHHGGDVEQTGSDPAGAPAHAVFDALALVEQAAQALDDVATWSLSDGQLRAAPVASWRRNRLRGRWIGGGSDR